MKNIDARETLILGSTGKTGRRVVQRFKEAGMAYREGSRQASIPFDWYDSSTWSAALQGVGAIYVVFYPDLAVAGAPDIIEAFTRKVQASGVERLVLLSGRGEPIAQTCEQIVMQSGLEWTVIRASWFAQNFSESIFLEGILGGHLALPFSDTEEPFIDVEDIADVAFAALTQAGHGGQLYEVTGPELLRFSEAVAMIATEIQRPIELIEVPTDAYLSEMRTGGVPDDFVNLLSYLFTEVLDGRNAHTTDGVMRALGRPARSFKSFAVRSANQGAWSHQVFS